MDHPLILAFGGSQVSPKYYSRQLNIPIEETNLFPEHVADKLGGFCINHALAGCCNSRLIRRTILESISQRELNPAQRIIVLLELNFVIRKEIWDSKHTPEDPAESQFRSVQIAHTVDWWTKSRGQEKVTMVDKITELFQEKSDKQQFLEKWQQGEMFFYSPYAENITLIQNLITLTALLKQLNIEYLIFRGNPVEKFEPEYVLDTFMNYINRDSHVLSLTEFSFNEWAVSNGLGVLEKEITSSGHPSYKAHAEFANFILSKL